MTVSYPRLAARTRNFTLGIPRALTVSPDGERVVFLRAASGVSRVTELWMFDVPGGAERRIVDPPTLLGSETETLSAAERARRERAREATAGVVGYATDAAVTAAVFALSSQLWHADLRTGAVTPLPAEGAVVDPRLDPTGRTVAYAADRALKVVDADGGNARTLVAPDDTDVTWGLAEFIAAEEMDRARGFWWSPDGQSLLVERYDESPVQTWHIADPAHPENPATAVRYPAAGTPNAEVSLWLVDLDGQRREVRWDRDRFEYLARVSWSSGVPLLQVLSRDQSSAQLLEVDTATGDTKVVTEDTDPAWVDLVAGSPDRLPDGRIVTTVDDADTRRLAFDGRPVTPPGMQVRAVLDTGDEGVLFTASTEPTEQQLYCGAPDGTVTALTDSAGVHTGAGGGDVVVVVTTPFDEVGTTVRVLRARAGVGTIMGKIESRQEPMPFTPCVRLRRYTADELRSAVLFPRDHQPGSRRLPLLLAPYGGPHGQLVTTALRSYGSAQWLADQGFAVLVTDGRGTPARGPAWERRVRHDFVGTLDDQVAAVEAVVAEHPDDVDPGRVGIRGWSYGGYLAALAVLRRPDVFHAAVAGAPVTDWRLYDTCYTERYLGQPGPVYDRNSLLDYAADRAADRAADLRRPLLLVHGLADDNVVVAHTLRLSGALLAAGRPHTVLPLSGITHMASQEEVAEALLRLEVDFLHTSLTAH